MANSFIGGGECGPVNPLARLTKTFDRDRSSQHDRYAGHGESSGGSRGHGGGGIRTSFRTSLGRGRGEGGAFVDQRDLASLASIANDGARGFGEYGQAKTTAALGHGGPQDRFSMQDLQRGLEHERFVEGWHAQAAQATQVPFEEQQRARSGPVGDASWALDFAQVAWGAKQSSEARQAPQKDLPSSVARVNGLQRLPYHRPLNYSVIPRLEERLEWQDSEYLPSTFASQEPQADVYREDWERHFENVLQDEATQHEVERLEEKLKDEIVIDDPDARSALAKTAGLLLENVQAQGAQRVQSAKDGDADVDDEVDAKFAKSSFMNLMRRLRDHEVAIEGDKVVEQGPAQREAMAASTVNPAMASGTRVGTGDGTWANEFMRLGTNHASPASSSFKEAMSFGPTTKAHAIHSNGVFNPAYEEAEHIQNERLGRDEINDIWAEDERERQEEEDRQYQKIRAGTAFQGDGGALAMEDLEESWRASRGRSETTQDAAVDGPNNIYKDSQVPGASIVNWEEDFQDDNFDLQRTQVGRDTDMGRAGPSQARSLDAQEREWDAMQRDWEDYDASMGQATSSSQSTSGRYAFQPNNPFLDLRPSSERSVSNHYESILEKEAEVQKNPRNARAWYELGLRQQENERESSAIAALERAVDIDPTLRDAWLALAVSHTNENSRESALDALTSWLETSETYKTFLAGSTGRDRHEMLTNAYVQAAANPLESASASLDADVQVGLGVLFNLTEEYGKAIDCFQTALSIRPQDDLLWNKLGATLANSHNVDAAIQAYHTALEINPSYTRCLYNLAVACLQRNEYSDSASHLLNALVIQSRDASGIHAIQGGSKASGQEPHQLGVTGSVDPNHFGGVTSSNLWDCLRMTLYLLNRPDLAERCDLRDLDSFRNDFEFDTI